MASHYCIRMMVDIVYIAADLCTGLDSTRLTWNSFINKSSDKWNMLALDQRGWGESPLGNEDEYTAAAVVGDIERAIKINFGDEKVVLLGHGMGGRVAIKFAATHPSRLVPVC